MGIKAKVIVGVATGVIGGLATWLGFRKKRGQQLEKVNEMISEVDLKEPEKEEVKTVDEMSNDVDDAIRGMDIDEVTETVDKINAEIVKEMGGVKPEDVLKDIDVGNGQNAQEWIDGALSGKNDKKLTADEVFEAQKKWEEKREERFKTTWVTDVEEAVKAKNYSKLENLFDEKYAGGPWHPSPASVFGEAKSEGVINDSIYKGAEKYFGQLWNYSGD